MSGTERDYYEVLGVPRDADGKTLRDAYRRLAMKWHPDRNKSPDAEARFKEIAKAYAILSDPDKRARYDARGFEGVAHYSHEDIFRGVDLGSLFGDLGFGFGPGGESIFDRIFGRRAERPARGRDARVRIEIPLERIARGGAQTVHFHRPATCPDCHGFGTRDGRPPPPCPACGGSGHRVTTREESAREGRTIRFQQVATCPECRGSGTAPVTPCPRCGGGGALEKEETLRVNIPAGIEEGVALRIPGHGFPGPPGAGAGDLYVVVTSAPDPRFQRRGADLWRSESLEVADAALGTRLAIPTLDGEVEVTVPPGTQPDAVLRLRGRGLPRFDGGGRGDLNLRLQVHVPEKLDSGERALYEQLRALRRER